MPRYLIGDKDGIVWSEPVNCHDETQAIVKDKKKAFTTDEEGNKVQVAEGYPCWEDGTALTDEEIEEALAPPQEKTDALKKYRDEIQKTCDDYGLTFPTSINDMRQQLRELYKDSKTRFRDASHAFTGAKIEIDEDSLVTLQEVLDV